MDIEEKKILLREMAHLQAENESLREQLLNYRQVIEARDKEIMILAASMTEANELRSDLDIKLDELQFLQNHIGSLQQQAEGAMRRENEMDLYIKEGLSAEQQLVDLKQQYTYLQTQLNDVQIQLQAVTDRNFILQQHLVHSKELESMLSIVIEERDELKVKADIQNKEN